MGSGCLWAHTSVRQGEGEEIKRTVKMFSLWELQFWSLTTTLFCHPLLQLILQFCLYLIFPGYLSFSLSLLHSLLNPYYFSILVIFFVFSLFCFYLFSGCCTPSLHLSLNSLSLSLSDMCIIAPSGWWLAMLIPLSPQEFIYTLIL